MIPLLSFHMQTNGGCADNHWRARPNRPRASHGSKTSPHAYVGEQLLAGGALHSGNTFWKN